MVSLMEAYKKLPGTNCRKCGENSCMSFAMKLLRGEVGLSKCTPLKDPKFREKKKELEKITSELGKAEETGLVINEETCNGCGNCVIACPVSPMEDPSAGGGKDPESKDVVLAVVDGKIRLINIKKCRRSGEDKRCRICADVCPTGSIDLV